MRRPITGVLTALAVVAWSLGHVGLVQAAVIYTTINNGTSLASIDTDTGDVTIIGPFGFGGTFGNAFDLDGTMYATLNASRLGTVDLTTGAATVVGNLPTNMYAIEFDSAGNLYGLGWNGFLYRLDKSNGSGSAIGYTGIRSTMDLAFDSGDRLYATVGGRLYQVDTGTGTQLSAIRITLGSANMGIMFDENDTLWATLYRRDSALYTLDPSTGVGTFVHNSRMYYPHGGDIYPIRSVVIDIKPGSVPNSVNVKSKGVLPVALLSTPEFADPSAVDVTSARFGPVGATAVHGGHIEDVNDDGNFDLVLHFKTLETGIACGDTAASLTGTTLGGQAIRGTDSVRTVPCK